MFNPSQTFTCTRSLSFDYDSKRRSDTFWSSSVRFLNKQDKMFRWQKWIKCFTRFVFICKAYLQISLHKTESEWVLMRTALIHGLHFLWLIFKVCCFLFYQRLDFSKSRLPLGNFIGGDSVGRFLIKWKFDFFHEVKNTNCTQNIACFQSFGHSVIK